ncbi:MAG: GNVR domain-containing protein [Pseudomonadota bacterium]
MFAINDRSLVLRVLLSAFAASILAGIYAFTASPVYRSEVLVVPVDWERAGASIGTDGGIGGLASIAGLDLGRSNQSKVEAIATLKSHSFIADFVVDEDIRKVLYADAWDESSGSWDEEPTVNDATIHFLKQVMSVQEDRGTGLVTLRIDWQDPTVGAQWANQLVDRLNAAMRNRSTEIATASISFLEKELSTTSNADTIQSINRLLEQQIHRIMIANVLTEYAFRVIDPAVPSDLDDPVFPNKTLIILIGFLLGAILSAGLILLSKSFSIRIS